MKMFAQEESMKVAPAPSLNAERTRDPLPSWDLRTWLVAIPLILVVTYAFIPVVANGFVAWDDDRNFLENPHFRGLWAAQVKWAWSTSWLGVYQPLAWLLFEAQYVFCKLDPRGYHLTSLILQIANAVVLYVLTVALLVRCRSESCLASPWMCSLSAGLATALFAVHPLRVEAVAWASSQPYLPCILFSMLSVLAYLHAIPRDSSPRWSWLVCSFLLFVAALLFKALAVSLPVVLLILDVYPLRRIPDATGRWFGSSVRRALLEKVPFAMTSLFFMGLAIAVREQSPFRIEPYDASEGMAQACYGTWFYVWKTVLPLNLITVYPLPRKLDWLAFPYNLSIGATLATTAALFLLRRRWPGMLAVWLSYLVILAPNAGIIRNNSFVITADRYSYMSMVGSAILVGAGFCWLWRLIARWQPEAPIGILAIGLVTVFVLSAMTRNQCRTWLNSETLWAHALTHGPNSSWVAHNNLGAALHSQKKEAAAAAEYAEALRLNPDFADAHNCLGTILVRLGRYADAETHLAEAVRLNPDFTDAHYNLGTILYRSGKYDAAIAHYAAAIQLRPRFAEAYNASANIMATCPDPKFRDGKGAVQFATRACKLTGWKDPRFLHTLAAAQAEAGDFDAAIKSQMKTLELVTGEREKNDCRSRLDLYRAKTPYREIPPKRAPGKARP